MIQLFNNEYCDYCQRKITTKCGSCHCDANEMYCQICEPNSLFFKPFLYNKNGQLLKKYIGKDLNKINKRKS